MTTFVLVHGAYHGGWCWVDVAKRLRAAGHEVFAPTITGLGERYHLATPEVGLDTHIKDIVNAVEWEGLRDFVLVGHSYGGMIIGGVADELGERIKAIVYLDALIPRNGVSVLDYNPAARREEIQKSAESFNGWQIPAYSAKFYGVADTAKQKWVDGKCVPHPLKSMSDKSSLSEDPHKGISTRVYLLCTNPPLPYMRQFFEWAQAQDDWICGEMNTGHDLMVTEPKKLSEFLLEFGQG